MYEMSCQSRFDARYWMLGAGALGRPRGMEWYRLNNNYLCGDWDLPCLSSLLSCVIVALGGARGWGRATSHTDGAQSLPLGERVLTVQGRLGSGDSWEEIGAVGGHGGP